MCPSQVIGMVLCEARISPGTAGDANRSYPEARLSHFTKLSDQPSKNVAHKGFTFIVCVL